MKLLLAVLAPSVIALGGCVTSGAYNWGSYDELLYQSYKDVTRTETMRLELEQHLTALEKRDQRVAPGLYAELGTLYLQAGDTSRAVQFYEKERATWPASEGLMTAMIANLERRIAARTDGNTGETAP